MGSQLVAALDDFLVDNGKEGRSTAGEKTGHAPRRGKQRKQGQVELDILSECAHHHLVHDRLAEKQHLYGRGHGETAMPSLFAEYTVRFDEDIAVDGLNLCNTLSCGHTKTSSSSRVVL